MPLIGLLLLGALIYAVGMAIWHFVLHVWVLGLTLLALWLSWKAVIKWAGREASRRNGLVRRADEQHRQVMNDDPDGIYGDYPPTT